MLNFCTLFDSNYLAKGLVLVQSLMNACTDFHLYIFAFDEKSFTILTQLNFKKVTVISLAEFEDEDLLDIKPSRSKAEYCWTSTPSTIFFCLKKYNLDYCTYIDADLFFYSNPSVLIKEMGGNDVLITEHRYTTKYDQSALSGKYCVQFMTFKNSENGLFILNWWKDACIEWCFNRREDGKFGDQKYLDDWMVRFKGVHELKHLGGGVAPWNVQQYKITKEPDGLKVIELSTKSTFDLVFFHFHHLNNQKFSRINEFYFGPYSITKSTLKKLYKPYIKKLKEMDKFVKSIDSGIDGLGSKQTVLSTFRLIAHVVKNSIKRNKIIWLR